MFSLQIPLPKSYIFFAKKLQKFLTFTPDAEIYTNVFSRIEKEEMEKFQYKINYQMIRNKIYEDSKILGKYNLVLDAVRFQKAHYEISPEWLHEEKERKNNMVFVNVRIKVSSK